MAVREGEISGWRALTLEDAHLRVTVLPEKGADIVELRDRASGVDPLLRTPWGLAPPEAPPREGSAGRAFLENYEGGWQELFPNAGDAADVGGQEVPFHGEVATLPWEAEAGAEELVLRVRCRRTPFELERHMRLEDGVLVLAETVSNLGGHPAGFVWAHHCVLGPPFLEAGCGISLDAATLETGPAAWEDTDRLAASQRSSWPRARLRDGGEVALDLVPGPETGSHDDVYVTGLAEGALEVANERLGLAFRLEWERELFPWVNLWMPYGGARTMPLRGIYGLGVEPWTTQRNLTAAAQAGEAVVLEPGERRSTELRAALVPLGGSA